MSNDRMSCSVTLGSSPRSETSQSSGCLFHYASSGDGEGVKRFLPKVYWQRSELSPPKYTDVHFTVKQSKTLALGNPSLNIFFPVALVDKAPKSVNSYPDN